MTQDATSLFLQNIIKGTETARQAFGNFLQSIADGMLRIVTGNIAARFVSILAGGTPGGGVFSAFAARAIGFSEGGIVPGTGRGDTVHAMLTPGEAVLPTWMVNQMGGPDVLRRFLDGSTYRGGPLPMFAGGGIVPPAMPAPPQVVAAVVSNSPEEYERFSAPNLGVLADLMAHNPRVFRQALGL